MSGDKDVENTANEIISSIPLCENSVESSKLAQEMKNYSNNIAIDTVNSMNRELQVLYDKYLELGVRSHLLEVDLATQFSPDLVRALEELNETCQACRHSVQELEHYSRSVEELKEPGSQHILNLDDITDSI